MKDQVKVGEMGKQPQTSVHGKKNPQMGQDASTKSDSLKKPKSGLPQPSNTSLSSNSACFPQQRLKKSSQEIPASHIPIFSSTSVVKEGPRLTLPARACLPASRIPCSISKLPNPSCSSGSHIRLKGGQGEKSEKVQKHQNPSLGTSDLRMKQAALTKHGDGGLLPSVRGKGLPPSLHGKQTLISINLPLKTKETSCMPIQSSLKTFDNGPALLSTYRVLKKQYGGDIPPLAPLLPSSDMKALLPPDDLDLPTPEFVSDEVVTSEIPPCKKHISNLALKFPGLTGQMEMMPSNLSKTGIIPAEYPCLSMLPKHPIPSSPTSLDFSPRVGQKKGSSKKKLGEFGSVSSTFSTKEFPENITESPSGEGSVSSNHNDIPDTKILSPSYPLPSSSVVKEMVLSVFHDVSKEEELLLSSSTQICTGIESSNASVLSSEEKVPERMEEEFDSGNGCEIDEETPTYKPCVFL